MRPIPIHWLKYASWTFFVQFVLFDVFLWWDVVQNEGDSVIALGITALSIFAYPNLKNAGWGFWGGKNLCPNVSTFLVACGVSLLSAIPFWMELVETGVPDFLFYLGWMIPGLLILRAYSTLREALKD